MTPSSAPARVAVITFPGSQDDRDAVLALNNLGAQAVPVWHADEELPDVGAVVLPGGFSYGDYLRAGALARFSPAMEAVARFAAGGGLVLGICNGFQILCEAGLLPGILRGNVSLDFVCRDVPVRVERRGHRLHLPLRFRPAAGHPGQARRRLLVRRRGARLRARGERPDPPPLRGEPERLAARRGRRDQPRGQRDGPHASPRARSRPAARLAGRRPHTRVDARRRSRTRCRPGVANYKPSAAESSGCCPSASLRRSRSRARSVTGPRRLEPLVE